MANDLSSNPLVIDTVQTEAVKKDQADASLPVWPADFKIAMVYWYNPTTIDHVATIKNKISGKVILQMKCEVAKQSQVFNFYPALEVPDIIVDALQSGTVYIYLLPSHSARR